MPLKELGKVSTVRQRADLHDDGGVFLSVIYGAWTCYSMPRDHDLLVCSPAEPLEYDGDDRADRPPRTLDYEYIHLFPDFACCKLEMCLSMPKAGACPVTVREKSHPALRSGDVAISGSHQWQ